MRTILAILTVLFLAPVCALAQSDGVPLGQISLTIDGTPVAAAVFGADTAIDGGTHLIGIEAGTVDASGARTYPSLNFRVVLDDGQPGPFTLIQYSDLDTAAQVHDIALAGAPFGERRIANFEIGATGVVSFDFSGRLLFVDDDWQPLPGGRSVAVAGSVTALVPEAAGLAN